MNFHSCRPVFKSQILTVLANRRMKPSSFIILHQRMKLLTKKNMTDLPCLLIRLFDHPMVHFFSFGCLSTALAYQQRPWPTALDLADCVTPDADIIGCIDVHFQYVVNPIFVDLILLLKDPCFLQQKNVFLKPYSFLPSANYKDGLGLETSPLSEPRHFVEAA